MTITSAKSNERRSIDDQTTTLVIKEFVQHFRQERNRQLWSVKTEISLQLLGQYVSWSVDGETDASISFFLPLVPSKLLYNHSIFLFHRRELMSYSLQRRSIFSPLISPHFLLSFNGVLALPAGLLPMAFFPLKFGLFQCLPCFLFILAV